MATPLWVFGHSTAGRSLDDKRYLFSFSALFVSELRLFIRAGSFRFRGLRIWQNVPYMAWMTQWLRSKFGPKSAGPRFYRATQPTLGHRCWHHGLGFYRFTRARHALLAKEFYLTRTINFCRNSGRVTPLAASAWICRYRLTPPWTDRPLTSNSIRLRRVLVVRTRDRP
jgi:hypothetical protein